MQNASREDRDTAAGSRAPVVDQSADTTAARSEATPHRQLVLRLVPELVLLVGCVICYVQTGDYDAGATGGPGPALYPRLLIILLATAVLVAVAQQVLRHRRARSGVATDPEPDELAGENLSRSRVAIVMAMAVGYVAATVYIGWVIATILLITTLLYLSGKRRLLRTVPIACVITTVFSFVFVKIVYIALPTGVGIFDEITYQFFVLIGAY